MQRLAARRARHEASSSGRGAARVVVPMHATGAVCPAAVCAQRGQPAERKQRLCIAAPRYGRRGAARWSSAGRRRLARIATVGATQPGVVRAFDSAQAFEGACGVGELLLGGVPGLAHDLKAAALGGDQVLASAGQDSEYGLARVERNAARPRHGSCRCRRRRSRGPVRRPLAPWPRDRS